MLEAERVLHVQVALRANPATFRPRPRSGTAGDRRAGVPTVKNRSPGSHAWRLEKDVARTNGKLKPANKLNSMMWSEARMMREGALLAP